MNYHTYDVAVMNYPLFDERINTDNLQDKIFDSSKTDPIESPVYIHIPFCDSLCDFCIYNRVYAKENDSIVAQYVNALIKEIKLYSSYHYIKNKKIGSVFIGGGTPTVLNEKQLNDLLSALKNCFALDGCEITVECNAANAGASKLKVLKDMGVTRISTGLQTFDNIIRKSHNIQKESDYVIRWIENTRNKYFQDVSIDLIYGFPNTDANHFLKDIKQTLKLNANHISVYKLTVFAYTNLYKKLENNEFKTPDNIIMEEMFYRSHDTLLKNGYEVQSAQEYGKKDNRVKFWDLSYDGYSDNISFGVSSFGYVNGYCYQNEPNVQRYTMKTDSQMLPIARISPKINEEQLPERTMIMGFRKGFVSKKLFFEVYSKNINDLFSEQITKQIEEKLIFEKNDGYYLTSKGFYNQGLVSAAYMLSIFKNVSPLKKKMCIGTHETPKEL